MTQDGSAPLTRRAAREARRAAAGAGDAAAGDAADGHRRAGWQPALDDDGTGQGSAPPGRAAAPDLRSALARSRERFGADGPADEPVPDPVREPQPLPVAEVAKTPQDDAADGPVARRGRAGGLAQAGAEDFSLAQAVGGVRGAAETLVPGLLFVSTYTITRDLTIALAVSVGAALLAIVLRVVTRSAPSQALSGAVGVGICAVFALLSGEARNFYLPGFLLNVGYGLLCLVSTIPFRRFRVPRTQRHVGPGPYPVIGLLLGPLTGEGLAWRAVPARLRVYQRVTWLWAGFFLLRLAVQVPLYLADLVGALGAARLAMGVPAFALMVWVSWLLLRSVPRALPDEQTARSATEQDGPATG